MTTVKSPPHQLRAQAHKIAESLKALAAGNATVNDPLGKIEASKARGYIDFAIVMDDKVLKIEIPWTKISELTQPMLCDFIFDLMSEGKHVAN